MFELFWVFLKIGLFSFGGGFAMVPLMQQELTLERDWLTSAQLTDFMVVAEVAPGPFAMNTAAMVGWTQHGFGGALAAMGGIMMPSFLVMLVVVALSVAGFGRNRWVDAAMRGVRPAVLGLIAAAVWTLARLFFFQDGGAGWWQRPDVATIAVFVVLMVLDWRFKLHPVALVGIAMALGLLVFGVVAPRTVM